MREKLDALRNHLEIIGYKCENNIVTSLNIRPHKFALFVNMEFGDRLKFYLEQEGLSPTQLATELGVNRSAVSHLVNNRNKPGFDFINKLRESFPDWDFEFLLFNQKRNRTVRDSVETKKNDASFYNKKNDAAQSQASSQYEQVSLFSSPVEQKPIEFSPAIGRAKKVVTRTILIYNDGTFEIFTNNLT
ncbi:MAG: helix-turn-helix transcriptional regulator [Bacteroidetes bacterium]|nr:helix-turn-helix transcriptional regulator [Bacteroidota bacterium]